MADRSIVPRLDRHIRYRARKQLLKSQGNRCALCGVQAGPNLVVDHDHQSGLVRGLLCDHCNRVLGFWENRRFTVNALKSYLQGERIDRVEMFIAVAQQFARRSTCPRKSVGAVFVRNNRIIAHGYNGAPPGMPHCTDVGCEIGPNGGCVRALHAELNALSYAAREGVRTADAEAYLTLAPCLSCAQLMITAGITRVIYLEEYRDRAGIELLQRAFVEVIDCA